jgi:large subunit ribosomal protein L4
MTAIPVYNADGIKTGELAIEPTLFDKAIRRPLLKQALISHLASQRQGTHQTKSRAFVAGGGRKPWKQKGTGRARQGSTRSPQWVGGGHAHHLEPRDYAWQLPAQQRKVALRSSLRYRLEKNAILIVDGLELNEPKTKRVATFLAKTGVKGKTLFVTEGNQTALVLSARNIPKISVSERRNLNAGVVLTNGTLVFAKSAIEALVNDLKKAN